MSVHKRAVDRLERALRYLDIQERAKLECGCGADTNGRDHAIDCDAFARVDVAALQNDLDTLARQCERMERIKDGLRALGVIS